MITEKSTRFGIASAAALLAFAALSATFYVSAAEGDKVAPCYGVNGCKGQSYCKSADHSCKGQNACKGQGFKDLTAQECAAQHGSAKPQQK